MLNAIKHEIYHAHNVKLPTIISMINITYERLKETSSFVGKVDSHMTNLWQLDK